MLPPTAEMGGFVPRRCTRRNLDAQLLGLQMPAMPAVAGEVDVLLAAGDGAGDAHALAVGLEVVEVRRCLGARITRSKSGMMSRWLP